MLSGFSFLTNCCNEEFVETEHVETSHLGFEYGGAS